MTKPFQEGRYTTVHKIWTFHRMAILVGLLALAAGAFHFAPSRPDAPTRAGIGPEREVPSLPKNVGTRGDPIGKSTFLSDFSFLGQNHGNPVVCIAGSRLITQKKKIGFFRVGFVREMIIENAVLDLYAFKSAESAKSWKCRSLFSKEVLGDLANQQEIQLAPVALKVNGGENTLVRISADHGCIRQKERDVWVSDNVVALSGDRKLFAEALYLKPEEGLLYVKGPFRLETEGRKQNGIEKIFNFLLEMESFQK